MKRRYLVVLVALVSGLLVLGAAPKQAVAAPAQAATTWTVLVGAEAEIEQTENGPQGAWMFNKFYPENLTINVGDTIVFKSNAHEAHNVYFPGADGKFPSDTIIEPQQSEPPRIFFNSGLILPVGSSPYDGTKAVGSGYFNSGPTSPTQLSLIFSKAGAFPYLCSIHAQQDAQTLAIQGMIGKITVNAAGTAYPKTQAHVNADAAAQIAADTAAVKKLDSQATAVTSKPGANGATSYTLNAGFMDMATMGELYRFSSPDLHIKVGDSVTWKLEGFHNVAFYSGGKEDDLILVEPQQNGPPKFELNPKVAYPAGGKVYSGTGYFNSGLPLGPTAPTSYTLTFDKAGHYEYICTIHDNLGMAAFITVEAAQATPASTPTPAPTLAPTPTTMPMPGLPDTGAGRSPTATSSDSPALLLVLAILLSVGGILVARRAFVARH